MHYSLSRFMEAVEAETRIDGARVLEVGSYNINGSIRLYFARAAEYVGVDWRAGPDVDRVVPPWQFPFRDESFDIAVTAATLEHDPHPDRTIFEMYRVLKPGGTLIVNAAGPGWASHELGCSPEPGYYGPIERDTLSLLLTALPADSVECFAMGCDSNGLLIKRGSAGGSFQRHLVSVAPVLQFARFCANARPLLVCFPRGSRLQSRLLAALPSDADPESVVWDWELGEPGSLVAPDHSVSRVVFDPACSPEFEAKLASEIQRVTAKEE